ncbi:MAG: NAD-dependent epimerase/dehydratase family protein [Bacteroidota bacterium]
MKILVTGAAGFIGFHVSRKLTSLGYSVVGLDNINHYYDVNLKFDRLKELGIKRGDAEINNKLVSSRKEISFSFVRLNLADKVRLSELFEYQKFDVVCNFAAQAGVRYSIENPEAYVQSNVLGFLNILECCKDFKIKHLIYASSSSVYGLNKSVPFKITDSVDHPISIYAATKKSNELMAHTYSHLYHLPTTGLRFFTVYGPWGRPDMAMFLFTKAILNGEPIKIFNNGKLMRDFTYVDDVANGVVYVIEGNTTERNNYKLYNIGNGKPIPLLDFINAIEEELGLKANRKNLPMQAGDVEQTWANVDDLISDYNYAPSTSIKDGIKAFIKWYKGYYL